MTDQASADGITRDPSPSRERPDTDRSLDSSMPTDYNHGLADRPREDPARSANDARGTMHTEKLFAWRGWLGAAIIIPAIVVACLSTPLVAEGEFADAGFDFIAWLTLGAGIFVRLWATLYIGGHKSMTLVTAGPYALSRHPLYVGSFLIMVALALFLISPLILAATLTIALFYALVIIPSEERHAITCFGDAYRAYAATTPRFWPRAIRLGRPGRVEVKVGEFLREFLRVYGFIALGAAADLLAACRPLPWWPKPFHLP